MTSDVVWMTPVALQRLQEELSALNALTRELDEAERSRLLELKDLLRRARAESKPDDGLVEPGMRVTVKFEDDGAERTFVFGSRAVLGLDSSLDVDVYSPESPLGAAIDGKYVGDTVTLESPKGPRKLSIVAAVPAT